LLLLAGKLSFYMYPGVHSPVFSTVNKALFYSENY